MPMMTQLMYAIIGKFEVLMKPVSVLFQLQYNPKLAPVLKQHMYRKHELSGCPWVWHIKKTRFQFY